MDVGRLGAHGVKQLRLFCRQAGNRELDPAAIGREPAEDPAAANLEEGIRAAHCPPDDGRIVNRDCPAAPRSPSDAGGDEPFHLAGDPAAGMLGESDDAGVPQAAEPRAPRDVARRVAGTELAPKQRDPRRGGAPSSWEIDNGT